MDAVPKLSLAGLLKGSWGGATSMLYKPVKSERQVVPKSELVGVRASGEVNRILVDSQSCPLVFA